MDHYRLYLRMHANKLARDLRRTEEGTLDPEPADDVAKIRLLVAYFRPFVDEYPGERLLADEIKEALHTHAKVSEFVRDRVATILRPGAHSKGGKPSVEEKALSKKWVEDHRRPKGHALSLKEIVQIVRARELPSGKLMMRFHYADGTQSEKCEVDAEMIKKARAAMRGSE